MNLALGLPRPRACTVDRESRRERHRSRTGSGPPASPPGSSPAARPTSPSSSTTARSTRPPRSSPPTAARPTRCSGAAGRRGRRRRARSCSTPAAPTATPARRASRPPTPTAEQVAERARRRRRRRRGLLDRADRRAARPRTSCSPASTRPSTRWHATTGGADAADGDHDHRHRRQAGRRSTAPAGRSAAWPRAPACSRPALATMLVVLTTDAVVDAADLRRGAAGGDPGHASTGSTPTAACRPTTPSLLLASGASGVDPERRRVHRRRRRGLHRPGPAAARATPRAPTTTSRSTVAATRPPRTTRSRSAARSPAATCSRPPIFGNDPNWGRVLAAVGTTQRRVRPGATSTSR